VWWHRPAAPPVDDGPAESAASVTLRAMSIEMRATEVRALAAVLRGSAADAEEIGARLDGAPRPAGPLHGPVAAFLDSHRAAGRALAGELEWLGTTVGAVADSWLRLDGALLPPHGWVHAE
jgi:hypothetical protein